MDHKESSIKIFYTKDYNRFSKIKGNRVLNTQKISRIKEDILDGLDMLKYNPILVAINGNKLDIIDGQHRFEVAKGLNASIWYIICNELTLLEIAKVNSNTEKWKKKDFIHCYAANGNNNYKILSEFMNVYKLPLSVSLQLLTTGSVVKDAGDNESASKAFETGKLIVKFEKEAIDFANMLLEFKEFPGAKSRCFAVALNKIIIAGKVGIADVIEAYKTYPDKLQMCGTWKEYLACIEVLINIGKKIRRIVY